MASLRDVVTVEWAPTSTPLTTTPTWVDITADVRSVNIQRGRSGVFDLFSAGTASIVVANSAHGYSTGTWYRWRQIRITATASGPTSNRVFTGHVDIIRHNQMLTDATATIECSDLLSMVARYEFNDGTTPTETTGARVGRVLAAIGVPSAWRSVATGYIDMAEPVGTVIGVETPGVINVNALTHLQDCTEAECGGFYVDGAGVVTFEDRYKLLDRLAAAAVTVFSDTPIAGEVKYLLPSLELAHPGDSYRNRVVFTGDDGDPQVSANVPAGFPPDTLSRSLPMASASQAMANAAYLRAVYEQDNEWPRSLTVLLFPGEQTALDEITALDLRELVTVEFTPKGTTQQTYKCFVDGIEHRISKYRWETTLRFSSADRWQAAWGTINDYLKLDDATYGLLDTAKLAP